MGNETKTFSNYSPREKELYNKYVEEGLPEFVENGFDNVEDILTHITDEGLVELDYSCGNENTSKKTHITSLGIIIEMTNRNNKPFWVVVCPEEISNTDDFRRRIYWMGKRIGERFPELIHPKPTLVQTHKFN